MRRQRLILICDKIMEYALYFVVFYIPISKAIIESFAILAILAFLVKKAAQNNFFPRSFVDRQVLLYLMIMVLSVITSSNMAISIKTFSFKIMRNVLLLFVINEVINTKKKMRNILLIFSLSALLISIDGLFQFFTHIDFIRHRGWAYSPEPFTFRISASFSNSNDFAAYLAPLLIIILGISSIQFRSSMVGSLNSLLFTLILSCIFLTLTRGAWIGVFLSLIFVGRFYRKKITIILCALAVMFLATWHILPENKKSELKDQFSLSNVGSYDRKLLAKISWNMFKTNPLIGLGVGTYMYNFDRFNENKDYYREGPRYAHNCYLQILAECGVLGLASFLWIIIVIFRRSLKILNKNRELSSSVILVSLLGGLVAYLIHSAFDTNLYNLDIGILFWVILGLAHGQLKMSEAAVNLKEG